jgi:predicted amidohydrolase
MKNGGSTPEQRIAYGYQRATAHAIDADSLKKLAAGLSARIAAFKAKPEEAKALLAQGMLQADETLHPAELAAYTTTASVLLNLDRVVTRD